MKKPKKKRGPEPDVLRVEENDWEEAVKKALKKPKPKDGWPEPKKTAKKGKS